MEFVGNPKLENLIQSGISVGIPIDEIHHIL